MARRNQYIKSKANYTLSKKHMTTYNGTIYEHDHMTIVPNDGIYDDSGIMFSDSNFKYRIRTRENAKKRHFSGNWVKPNDDFEFWTASDCTGVTNTSETKIILKPNYTSLRSFAYFGSSKELVKSSIMDIVLHYPGGIAYLGDESESIEIDGNIYYTVSNDFEIDIWNLSDTSENYDNSMRLLSDSYKHYIYGMDGGELLKPQVTPTDNICDGYIIYVVELGDMEHQPTQLYVYQQMDGHKILLAKEKGVKGQPIIRPNNEKFAEMFEKLDDFSKNLLNMTRLPIFTSEFDTPYFNNDGFFYSLEKYTFPSLHTEDYLYFQPRLSGGEYNSYLTRLLSLAEFMDSKYSDNIIRMLTHESIINMDWTMLNMKNEDDGNDDIVYDNTRMSAMLHLYGRQFDDLKRFADNIKTTNTITYNEKDNTPDYFLSDKLNNLGWESTHVGPSVDESDISEKIYTNDLSGYTSSDANLNFNRRLCLSSKYIQSLKGTRNGVSTLLKMFGFTNSEETNNPQLAGSFDIHEYVAVASEFPKMNEINLAIQNLDDYDDNMDRTMELPIAVVNLNDANSDYAIPWFDKSNKNTDYMYFQMKGGWKHKTEKNINLSFSNASSITETQNTSIYGETLPYLRYANDIDELTAYTNSVIEENLVCYVNDISDIYDNYEADIDDQQIIDMTSGDCFSHYFILKTPILSNFIGFVNSTMSAGRFNCYGWRNVLTHEMQIENGLTDDGTRVLYLESLQMDLKGNNPHVGYGHYDDGIEYLEYYNQIFKDKLDNNMFSTLVNDTTNSLMVSVDSIKNIGFGVDYALLEDNKKCHTFTDIIGYEPNIMTNDLILGEGENTENDDNDDNDSAINFIDDIELMPIGDLIDEDNDETTWTPNFYNFLHNPEEPEASDDSVELRNELAALSVINVKNLKINFTTNHNPYLRKYIEDVVIKYVEQLIPSTAIFRYTFDGEEPQIIPMNFTAYQSYTTEEVHGDIGSFENAEALTEYNVMTDSLETIDTMNNNMLEF